MLEKQRSKEIILEIEKKLRIRLEEKINESVRNKGKRKV